VPGCLDLAEKKGVFIGGDDFKSGQTKLKSVLVDFLVSAGIKPRSIVSYNHLGNNDGKNLSAPQTFRSKEVFTHLQEILNPVYLNLLHYLRIWQILFLFTQFMSAIIYYRFNSKFKNIYNNFSPDFQKQRCRRHGGIKQDVVQQRRDSRPLRRHQVRPSCWGQ
jgi:hypothetical protein